MKNAIKCDNVEICEINEEGVINDHRKFIMFAHEIAFFSKFDFR